MKLLSIGQVTKATGATASALRYYEKAGLLPKPARAGGKRLYDAGIIRHVDVLRFAKKAGFSLREIRALFHGFDAKTPLRSRWQDLIHTKLLELDMLEKRVQKMKRALQLGLACGCVKIEDCTLSDKDAEAAQPLSRGCCG